MVPREANLRIWSCQRGIVLSVSKEREPEPDEGSDSDILPMMSVIHRAEEIRIRFNKSGSLEAAN
jgi:hypothetical protein